jgi:hypothetical protein
VIVAFSTSSPQTSVAAIDRASGVLWQGHELAPQGASGACMRLLEAFERQTGLKTADAEMFVADIGPGSFTGVRVGVTLAKTFGFLYSRPAAGASSFDLISSDKVVVMPSKKNELFIRRPGFAPIRSAEPPSEPFVGFGPGIEPAVYPDAAGFAALLDRLVETEAMSFVPEYLIEPSISVPKKPFASSVVAGG